MRTATGRGQVIGHAFAHAGWLAAAVVGAVLLCAGLALGKDDHPRALGAADPWHPKGPSHTAIALACGAREHAFVLEIDDRSWLHVTASDWEAMSTPFGRFLRTGAQWRPLDESGWLAPRVEGLSLREIAGEPIFPAAWRLGPVVRDAHTGIVAQVREPGGASRVVTLDALLHLWVEEGRGEPPQPWIDVTDTLVWEGRVLPTRVRVGECVMTRVTRAGSPVMPSRAELLGEAPGGDQGVSR